MSQQHFLGTWKLVSSHMRSGDDIVHPLGEDCRGILTFDGAGKLAAQLMNPQRPNFASDDMRQGTPEEVQAAYLGYVSFWGAYDVDPAKGIMRYQVEGSLFPNWIGHPQERFYAFEGNRLTLQTTPLSLGGKEVVGVLVWEKIA